MVRRSTFRAPLRRGAEVVAASETLPLRFSFLVANPLNEQETGGHAQQCCECLENKPRHYRDRPCYGDGWHAGGCCPAHGGDAEEEIPKLKGVSVEHHGDAETGRADRRRTKRASIPRRPAMNHAEHSAIFLNVDFHQAADPRVREERLSEVGTEPGHV